MDSTQGMECYIIKYLFILGVDKNGGIGKRSVCSWERNYLHDSNGYDFGEMTGQAPCAASISETS